MKKLFKSKNTFNRMITCIHCSSVFETEDESDFQKYGKDIYKIKCPSCGIEAYLHLIDGVLKGGIK